MNRKALLTATAAGTIAQLAMVMLGHYVAAIRDHGFAIGGMLISLLAGALYVRMAKGEWASSLIGSAIAGGVCALITIPISAALGDTPIAVVSFGTFASTVTGLVGGALARVGVRRPA